MSESLIDGLPKVHEGDKVEMFLVAVTLAPGKAPSVVRTPRYVAVNKEGLDVEGCIRRLADNLNYPMWFLHSTLCNLVGVETEWPSVVLARQREEADRIKLYDRAELWSMIDYRASGGDFNRNNANVIASLLRLLPKEMRLHELSLLLDDKRATVVGLLKANDVEYE